MSKLAPALPAMLLFAVSPLSADTGTPATPESPRLRELAAAIHAGNTAAVDDFWKDIAVKHSPLIEEVPGHPHEALYTFLWQAAPDQQALNVSFNGWFPLHSTTGGFDAFVRLEQSDVWYTSYTLSRSSHLRYELVAPKGWHAAPERASFFTMNGTEYETFHDPLNPRLNKWNNSTTSYVEGPDARTSPYLRSNPGDARAASAGTLSPLEIKSRILGNSRTLQIYLPPGYGSSRGTYGLLLAYDGIQYTQAAPVPQILDNMIAARVIAPVIAVFLESPDRDVEFPPNDRFQEFVATELIPLLRSRYHLSTDPRRNAVLGSSYGGIAAAYTAFKHPELFANVISQSGSFGWSPPPGDPASVATNRGGVNPDAGWLIKRIAEAPRERIRFHLDAGTWEGGNLLYSNRLLQSVLEGKGYEVTYDETDGNHSSYYWMLRLPDGLLWTLAKSDRDR
jgi:enterochelin esterase-like enzyme